MGYRLSRLVPRDLEPEFMSVYRRCAGFSATSPERMYAIWQAVRYVDARSIDGDLVECGVWRGGSAMLMAYTLIQLGDSRREILLYDTFAGMTAPSPRDGLIFASWSQLAHRREHPVVAYASRQEVERHLATTGFDRFRLIEGPVEATLPSEAPEKIAVLRLDTDWYESTKHELETLWPRLELGGVLLIDDYGHWEGARAAVDEFFADRDDAPLLARTDYTGRIAIKTG